jgi:rod shape-determining protein MreD
MATLLRLLLTTFAVLLLEGTVGARVTIAGMRPDLSLAWVVYAGLLGGRRRGVAIGLLVGLLRGCLDPQWFGLEGILLSGVGFAAGSISGGLNRSHPVVPATLIFFLLLAHDLARALFVTGGAFGEALGQWARYSIGTALYTALLVPLAVALLPLCLPARGRRGLS